jgi:hypothetical protein
MRTPAGEGSVSTVPIPTCQVCQNEPGVGVCASTLGPISLAWGAACLSAHAEPLNLIHATFDLIGGPEHAAPWFKSVRSYKDGVYIGWDEIVSSYVPSKDLQ